MQRGARQGDGGQAGNLWLLGAALVLVIHEVIPVGRSREGSGRKGTCVLLEMKHDPGALVLQSLVLPSACVLFSLPMIGISPA